jgi:hypothetical protein
MSYTFLELVLDLLLLFALICLSNVVIFSLALLACEIAKMLNKKYITAKVQ